MLVYTKASQCAMKWSHQCATWAIFACRFVPGCEPFVNTPECVRAIALQTESASDVLGARALAVTKVGPTMHAQACHAEQTTLKRCRRQQPRKRLTAWMMRASSGDLRTLTRMRSSGNSAAPPTALNRIVTADFECAFGSLNDQLHCWRVY